MHWLLICLRLRHWITIVNSWSGARWLLGTRWPESHFLGRNLKWTELLFAIATADQDLNAVPFVVLRLVHSFLLHYFGIILISVTQRRLGCTLLAHHSDAKLFIFIRPIDSFVDRISRCARWEIFVQFRLRGAFAIFTGRYTLGHIFVSGNSFAASTLHELLHRVVSLDDWVISDLANWQLILLLA